MEDKPKKLSKRELKAQKFKEYKKGLINEDAQKEEEPKEDSVKKGDTIKEEETKKEKVKVTENKSKKQKGEANAKVRYIVFVGNLSFKTTKEEVMNHFKSCGEIISVRLMTDKNTGKSKGFAFLELGDSKSLEKALQFHHTKFQYRQINVELSAGGGGKGENRKQKIQSKNEKLNKERERFYKDKIEPNKNKKKQEDSNSNYQFVNPERIKRVKTD